MPDTWENAHGLNPNDLADRGRLAANGYSSLENYLNDLVAAALAVPAAYAAEAGLQAYPNPATD